MQAATVSDSALIIGVLLATSSCDVLLYLPKATPRFGAWRGAKLNENNSQVSHANIMKIMQQTVEKLYACI